MERYGKDISAADHEIQGDARKIRQNKFLEEIYLDVYRRITAEIPASRYPRLLEIGSGGGFFRDIAPHAITSECAPAHGIDRVIDACRLEQSFEPASLDAIAAFDVFHHLPDVAGFLRGAERVLRPGGRVVLIEPWFTPVGQWLWRLVHHEPVILDPNDWSIVGEGRLGGANGRLPTSVFRDSPQRFAAEFPALRVVKRDPFHKGLYALSGGLRLNTRVPRRLAKLLLDLDRRTGFLDDVFGVFALIVVERVERGEPGALGTAA
jgi:SAM-dependent methyltransferase